MKKRYAKLTEMQKSRLSANTLHWTQKDISHSDKGSHRKKKIRTLFYKPNIKDY